MAIISVEVPDEIAVKFKPYTVVKYESLILNYYDENIEFDFKKENIDQNEFLSYLQSKHG